MHFSLSLLRFPTLCPTIRVRDIFTYYPFLMVVEKNKMRMIETIPGEVSPNCIFETNAGESIRASYSPLSENEKAQVISVLRDILKDEDLVD